MTVIINQHGGAGLSVHRLCREFTQQIKATARALETLQRSQDSIVFNAFFTGDGDGGCRIQGVVASRRVQRNLQRCFILTDQGEMPLRATLFIIFNAQVSIITETVRGDMASHAWDQVTNNRIIHTHHRTTVKRQVVQEVNKRLLQVLKIALIGVHMVSFDVGHNRHHRLQMQERRIALIRFSNQIPAVAQTGMGACCFNQSAVNKGRIETRFCINTRHHRRGGRFAMGTRNGDAMTKTHQLSQHLRATDHRDTLFTCRHQFGVILRNGAGNHDDAGISHVFGAMVKINGGTQRNQVLRHRIRGQI